MSDQIEPRPTKVDDPGTPYAYAAHIGSLLSRFRSHKVVSAGRIVRATVPVSPHDDSGLVFVEHEDRSKPLAIPVHRDWFVRHTPEVGGYYVVYEDGYASYSPAKAFEDGYTRVDPQTDHLRMLEEIVIPDGPLPFELALRLLKTGHRVARAGWNGKGMWLLLMRSWKPTEVTFGNASLMSGDVPFLPFIAMFTAHGELVPWLASQTDMLAEDWEIVG